MTQSSILMTNLLKNRIPDGWYTQELGDASDFTTAVFDQDGLLKAFIIRRDTGYVSSTNVRLITREHTEQDREIFNLFSCL